jgi:bifunctional non-homologous end joining protein LigD
MARAESGDPLATYKAKRDFGKTPEPAAKRARKKGNSFVIQKHAARRTHFDFRLEHDGVLKSWAVTRGPSLDPSQKRLAVRTEDHPLEYGGFEGVIPKGEYGGGPVMIWDEGTWEPIGDPNEGLKKGDLKFRLHGKRLNGDYVLVRMKKDRTGGKRENWLLIKKRDDYAGDGEEPTEEFDTSVKTGRSMDEIETGADSAVWSSNKAQKKTSKPWRGKAKKGRSRKAVSAHFVEPQLATLESHVPAGREWLHELKYDGYRIEARKAGDDITLFSRSGLDWTVRFPAIAKAMLTLPCESALIDGEAAYVLPSGVTDFKSLQDHIDKPDPAIRYFAFDLLSLDGKDLRKEPLAARKEKLRKLMAAKGVSDFLIYSDHVEGSGQAFFDKACAAELEGIMCKRADAPYRSGRGKSWLKVKCTKSQEFVIGGFAKSDVRGRPFSSLLLGTYDGGKFIYSGKVGTGFNTRDMKELAKRFKPLERKTSPFVSDSVPAAERKGAVWLRPELVCAVNFTEWTRDGRLRHPSFQGLREDKPASAVVREDNGTQEAKMATKTKTATTKTAKTNDVSFGGVTLTSPDKVLYPEIDFTKLDLARYYESVAETMLPYVAKRPISLVRCPEGLDGERFFQRHAMKGMSDAIKQVPIPGGETKKPYLYIENEEGLFALAQISALEIHDWGVSLKKIDKPDRLVFDLDPDEELDFTVLRAAAQEVRSFLDDLGLTSFLKATGGKGLHIVAPLTPKAGWDEVKEFSKAIADALVTARPDRYTANPLKRTRVGKIFVDYLRNQRGSSAICNYSTRAKTGAPVAVPLRWDELKRIDSGAPYTVKTLPARLKRLKSDPWEGFSTTRQSITVKAKKALGLS